MASPTHIRKRLIVCCDGTWQSSVTGQKNVPSNVTRLARAFAREGLDADNQLWKQVVYYDAGIGTGEITKSERDRQGGFGHGFVGNVIEAYNFLATNYELGDKVYCFGFSRGAYTARAVAGLVNDIGIISARDMQDFPDLYDEYQKYKGKDPHGFRKTPEYRKWQIGVRSTSVIDDTTGLKIWEKIPHAKVEESSRIVEVVGVFDTVGSLGVPKSPFWTVSGAMRIVNAWWGGKGPGFHNVTLSPYIRNAFHAMALDEHRKPFTPTLWQITDDDDPEGTKNRTDHLPTPEQKQEKQEKRKAAFTELRKLHPNQPDYEAKNGTREDHDKNYEKNLSAAWAKLIKLDMEIQYDELKEPQNLKQVWFPGVHINVGGGNSDVLEDRRGDFEQIALISFAWMVEQCKPFLAFEPRIRKRSVRDRMALMLPVMAEMREGRWKEYGDWIKPLWRTLEYLWLYTPKPRDFAPKVVVGWAEGPIVDSYTLKMRLTGSQHRTPGDYGNPPDDPERKKDRCWKNPRYTTNEAIHPSVTYRRWAVKDYEPKALDGFTRSWTGTQWVWSKPAVKQEQWFWDWREPVVVPAIEVPEYPVPVDDDTTAQLIPVQSASKSPSESSAAVPGKFSRFLTKDYVDFLKNLESQEDDDLVQRKSLEAWRTAEEKLLNHTKETTATEFLIATAKGEDWDTKGYPVRHLGWWARVKSMLSPGRAGYKQPSHQA